MIGLALLNWVGRDLLGAPGTPARGVLLSVLLSAAVAPGVVAWRWTARRVKGLAVEVSEHPFRPGGRYEVAVLHDDPAELPRVSVTLFRVEDASAGDQRGGKNSTHERTLEGRVELEGPDADVRRVHLDISRRAVASMALGHHWVDWSLAVRLGGRLPWTVKFPVTVEGSGRRHVSKTRPPGAPPPRKPRGHAVEREGPAALWLNSGAEARPGATLSMGYAVEPVEGRVLESVEAAVLWESAPPGWKDLGVCYYEGRAAVEGDDLPLYGARSFQVTLPDGPPSYDGKAVKVRWLARLRLRYADGGEVVREVPFALGRAEAAGLP
jgi:hypothetical protein